MGLILDTSALIAWERAHHAGLAITIDDNEQMVLPADLLGRSLGPGSAWPIPPPAPRAAWPGWNPCGG